METIQTIARHAAREARSSCGGGRRRDPVLKS